MNIKLDIPKITDLKPRISVIGIGGAGCNAINNMIATGLEGVEFVAANTDAQALAMSRAEHQIQLGAELTEGLGAGARPEVGRGAAEEAIDEIRSHIEGCHMVFLAAGMGGGTGTGAISVVARVAREMDILTVAIVSKPFQFEGSRRMRTAEEGIKELSEHVDTLIVIPNQNLFRIANPKTTFAEAFVLADQVLYSGIACIVDLIVKDGLINLDFADVKAVMKGMGSAMMGTGEATGEERATLAAEKAIANPLLDEISLTGARGLLISIIGDQNLTLFEVDEAASRVKSEAHPDANIIVGASFEDDMDNKIRVSIVAAGLEGLSQYHPNQYSGSQLQSGGPQSPTQSSAWISPGQQGATDSSPTAEGSRANAPHPTESQQQPGANGASGGAFDYSVPRLDREADESSKAIASALAPSASTGNQNHPTSVPSIPPAAPAPLAPPPLPATAPSNVDPYLGDTPAEEFARALEDVIKSVASDSGEDAGGGNNDWVSPDGVSIRDGLSSPASGEVPAVPYAMPPNLVAGSSEFAAQQPAAMPRRVPDNTQLPPLAQQDYTVNHEGIQSADDEQARQGGGMPGLLRRIAGFGRQGAHLAEPGDGESLTDSSRTTGQQFHSDGQTLSSRIRR